MLLDSIGIASHWEFFTAVEFVSRECCLSIPSLEFCFCSSKQTEVVLDMTRYITNQVLEQRGMIGARIPNLHSLSNRNGRNSDAGRALCLNGVKSVLKTFLFLTNFK